VASQLVATPLARLSVLSLIYGGVYGALAWSFGLIRKTEQDALLRWVQPLSLSRFRLREL
jgi:hypothetical protein